MAGKTLRIPCAQTLPRKGSISWDIIRASGTGYFGAVWYLLPMPRIRSSIGRFTVEENGTLRIDKLTLSDAGLLSLKSSQPREQRTCTRLHDCTSPVSHLFHVILMSYCHDKAGGGRGTEKAHI